MEISLLSVALLSLAGFVAGFINTLAGGGSNLTLPALMMLGLPADIANATNRVGVLLQAFTGMAGFDRHRSLDRAAIGPILLPTLLGGAGGALAAAMLPNLYLKPVLLLTILTMAGVILIRPELVAPAPGTATRSPRDSRGAWWALFGAGVYGGFVQAGVGFILLAALAGGLRYDLVRANALKVTCAFAFTLVAVAIFVVFDQVRWIPGLILGLGSMVGAQLGVRFAIQASPNSLKWFLFLMTLAAVLGGFLL